MTRVEATGHRRRPTTFGVIAIGAVVFLAAGLAIARGVAAEPEATSSPQAAGYLPSISDLMIATIQPRHERLWRAGQDGNWDFAAYEVGNLAGAFGRLGHAHPIEDGMSFSDMISSVTGQPFKELGTAIQAKDGAAFIKAYAGLTESCNSCHQALNHGIVEIHVPNLASRSDRGVDSTARN